MELARTSSSTWAAAAVSLASIRGRVAMDGSRKTCRRAGGGLGAGTAQGSALEPFLPPMAGPISPDRRCACAPVHASPTDAVLVEQSVNFNPLVAARALLLQQVLCIWFVCGVFVIQMFVG